MANENKPKTYETMEISMHQMFGIAMAMAMEAMKQRGVLTQEQTEEMAMMCDTVVSGLLRGEFVSVNEGNIITGEDATNMMRSLDAQNAQKAVESGQSVVAED